jgi:outer membrane biosynthesis protein TonB
MKAIVAVLLLGAVASPVLLAQAAPSSAGSVCKRIRQEAMYISVSAVGAEKLLIHKVDPVWNHKAMEARVSGTVVVQFELGKHGEVLCPRVISGPQLLQQPVLNAIRKYEYKPYLLNGEAVLVSTTASVTTSNY